MYSRKRMTGHFAVFLFNCLICIPVLCCGGDIVYNNREEGLLVADNVINQTVLRSFLKTSFESNWKFDHLPMVVHESGLPSTAYFAGGFSRFVPYEQSGKKEDFVPMVRAVRVFVEKHLQPSVDETEGNETRVAVIRSSIREKFIAAGDFAPVTTACANDSAYLAIINQNTAWTKNDYGDITFYDTSGEIIRSFHPRFGRLYLVKCGTRIKVNPPSIDTAENLNLLLFEVSILPKHLKKPPTVGVVHEVDVCSGDYIDLQYKKSLAFIDKLNPQEYAIKDLNTTSGKRIIVFQDVFPEEYLDLLYEYHENFQGYQLSGLSKSSDNVKWVLGTDEKNFSSNSLWRILQKLLIYTAGDDTHTFYDITCNHIRRGDNTLIHRDCPLTEKEYTILIYLNRGMTVDHYGETVFFTEDQRAIEYVLLPKFGRVVIFEGTIPHSARPPSPLMEGVRFTYAVKTTLRAGKERKQLADSLYNADDLSVKVEKLVEKLRYATKKIEESEVDSVSIEDLRLLKRLLIGD